MKQSVEVLRNRARKSRVLRFGYSRAKRIKRYVKNRNEYFSSRADETYQQNNLEKFIFYASKIKENSPYYNRSLLVRLYTAYVKLKKTDSAESILRLTIERFHEQDDIISLLIFIIQKRSENKVIKAFDEFAYIISFNKLTPCIKSMYLDCVDRGYIYAAKHILEFALKQDPSSEAFTLFYINHLFAHFDDSLTLKQVRGVLNDFNIATYKSPSQLINTARYLEVVLPRESAEKDLRINVANYWKKWKKGQNKTVVYTVLVGDYDSLKQPVYIEDGVDYIVFTDKVIKDSGVYQVAPLPYIHRDPTRSARYVKTHPHILLKEYETAVWIDASILINTPLHKYLDKRKTSGHPLGAVIHPDRSDYLEEAAACIRLGKDAEDEIINQINAYTRENLSIPGLIESGFLIMDLQDPKVLVLLNEWWKQIDNFSRRDQISFPYAAAKAGITWDPIFKKGKSVRNVDDFILTSHHTAYPLKTGQTQTYTGMQKNNSIKNVSVVVPVYNQLDAVRKCLKSIEETLPKGIDVTLIIINDASKKPTSNYLESFAHSRDWVVYKKNLKNLGYTKSVNKGLRLSKSDITIILNSDCVVTENWISKITSAHSAYPGIDIIGVLSNAAGSQSIPNNQSISLSQTATNSIPSHLSIEKISKLTEKWNRGVIITPLVHGFCMSISRKILDSVGYFDQKLFPIGYGEENDLCFKATDAGFTIGVATNIYLYHSKSASFSSKQREELRARAVEKLLKKYGTHRLKRAEETMHYHPVLEDLRNKARKAYESKS